MRTFYAMLFSFAIPASLLSICIFFVPSPLLKGVGILVVLFMFGILIPISLDEAGLFFSWYLKLYPLGIMFSKASMILYNVPIWKDPNFSSFAPMNLAKVLLARGEKKEAKHLAREALSKSHLANWRINFRCLSTLGEIQYHNDEYAESKLQLLKAKNLYDSNFEIDPVATGNPHPIVNKDGELETKKSQTFGIDEELKQYYVQCLDLLGLLTLLEGNYDESQSYFSQGILIRHNSDTLKQTSRAYKQYVDGLLLLSRDSSDQTMAEEKIIEAANLLPQRLTLMQDQYVLIAVSRALAELHSSAALKLKSGFKTAYKGKLHSYQLKLLDRPIFS